MLNKIISVKSLGRFRSSAGIPNPELRKISLIAGANGYGKTTLCALLRSLQTGDPSHLLGRQTLGSPHRPTVEILWDLAPIRFDGARWTEPKSEIAIFDSVFVAENVHSGEVVELGHKRNLYRIIVGADGVRLAEEDATLSAHSRELTAAITQAARAIQPHLAQGMTLEAFKGLSAIDNIDGEISEQARVVASAREAAVIRAKPGLKPIELPTLPERFTSLLSQTLEGIGADAEALIRGHFERHNMTDGGAAWATTGLRHIQDENCPFCEQNLEGVPLIGAYRAVFSEQYRNFVEEIERLRAWVASAFGDNARGRVEIQLVQNQQAVEFWNSFCGLDAASLRAPGRLVEAMTSYGTAALKLIEAKASTPLADIALTEAYSAAKPAYEQVASEVIRLNEAIAQANRAIEECRASAGSLSLEEAERRRRLLEATKIRHSPAVAALCAEHDRLTTDKEQVDARREGVRARLTAHTNNVVRPYESRINTLLRLFNAGFSISGTSHSYPGGTATSSYSLVINDTTVDLGSDRTPADQPSFKNTLSAGDRTTLALAFFIAHLERDPDIAGKVVVFDDPFNSQDAFRRRQTVIEIMKMAASCEQVIVLSHDASFLKLVWDKAAAAERVALGINDHRSQGSKISEIDLERACAGRNATDLDDLQTYLATGAGPPLDLIRKMRVVLEAYLMAAFPAAFEANDWLGPMVGKIRDGGEGHPAHALYDELDAINEYSCQYHHREDVATVVPDQIDPAELTGFVERTLRLVNALQS